jgi:Domain of unknown function (DUF1835)
VASVPSRAVATSTARTLHLTNGTAIFAKVRAVAADAPVVAWNDILHEGPVPAGLGPAALRERRVDFLAAADAASRQELTREFESRDLALEEAIARADEIVLWLEHDLYDQLHLIQILDRVPVDGPPAVTLVPATGYLGDQPASDYPGLFEGRRMVTSTQRLAARDAWQAFRSPDPRAIVDALPRVTALPHLAPALLRHLEQFPSVRNGLSRTEQATLEVVADGISRARDVFVATQRREEAFFMGDAGFFFHISSIQRASCPLLRVSGDVIELTPDGRRVLKGEADRIALCGIDRWLGGVYLSGAGPMWRWDTDRRVLRSSDRPY